jgi:hypothetical protein
MEKDNHIILHQLSFNSTVSSKPTVIDWHPLEPTFFPALMHRRAFCAAK